MFASKRESVEVQSLEANWEKSQNFTVYFPQPKP